MNSLEKAARREWLWGAIDWRYGRCDTCGRLRSDENRPLLVARQVRRRKFECLDCFDGTRVQGVAR